jgi:hypothetical protein
MSTDAEKARLSCTYFFWISGRLVIFTRIFANSNSQAAASAAKFRIYGKTVAVGRAATTIVPFTTTKTLIPLLRHLLSSCRYIIYMYMTASAVTYNNK